MDKPKLSEILSATNELAAIGAEAVRECAADFICWALQPARKFVEAVDEAQEWEEEVEGGYGH